MFNSILAPIGEDHTLTETAEVEAILAAQAGDEGAAMTLIRAYSPAIRSAVATFGNGIVRGRDPWAGNLGTGTAAFSEDDLVQTAVLGVMDLIQTHDASKSPRLAGRVKQYIADAMKSLFANIMPSDVPSRTLTRWYGILKAADGDVRAAEALSPSMDMSASTFREIHALVRQESLEGLTSAEDGGTREISFSPLTDGSPVADVEDRILCDMAFGAVDDEQESICRLAYGFTEYEPVPDAEIAHRMGQTRPTIQRKRGKALGEMRKAIGVAHISEEV